MNRARPEPDLRRPDWCELCQADAPAGVGIAEHLTTEHEDVFGDGPLEWPDHTPVLIEATAADEQLVDEQIVEDLAAAFRHAVLGQVERQRQLAAGGFLLPGHVVGEGVVDCVLRPERFDEDGRTIELTWRPRPPAGRVAIATPPPAGEPGLPGRGRLTTLLGVLRGRRRKEHP